MLLDRRIGSHTKTSGGLAKAALPYVDAAGSETLQVYVSNSRGWALPPGDPQQDTLFRDGIGVFRPSTHAFTFQLVAVNGHSELRTVSYGQSGDVPVIGDWTGTGADTQGVIRQTPAPSPAQP